MKILNCNEVEVVSGGIPAFLIPIAYGAAKTLIIRSIATMNS